MPKGEMTNNKKVLKFYASEVENILIRYAVRRYDKPGTVVFEEFDAL
jgi:hypothetical protein